MAGRQPAAAKFNPGVRSPEQERRRQQHKSVQLEQQPQAREDRETRPSGRSSPDLDKPVPEALGFGVGTAGPVAVTADAAQAVKDVLSDFPESSMFYILRVTVDFTTQTHGYIIRQLLRQLSGCLIAHCSADFVVGKVYPDAGDHRHSADWCCLACLSPLPQERLLKGVTDFCHSKVKTDGTFRAVVESGPHECPPDLAEPKELKVCSRFSLPGCQPDLMQAARSSGIEDLLQHLRQAKGTVSATTSEGVTGLHLAALTGSAVIVDTLLERTGLPGARSHNWRDCHGRTPLHYAALLDIPDVARPLLKCLDAIMRDRWGRTAFDLASALGNHCTANVLAASPPELRVLCEQRVQTLLSGEGDVTSLGQIQLPDGLQLVDCVPLHNFKALKRLASLAPGSVGSSKLLRSQSCMECWYADLLNRGCAPALPDCMCLTRLFESPPTLITSDDERGAVLASAPPGLCKGVQGTAAIADRATFLNRFQRRTGGVLKYLDWRNVMAIGGMVLACLTADDKEYARDYAETDVDLYVVGLSGEAFKKRVAEVVSVLPRTEAEDDYFVQVQNVWSLRVRGNRGHLIVDSVGSAKARYSHSRELQRGDAILEIIDEDYRTVDDIQEMRKKLTQPKGKGKGKGKGQGDDTSVTMKIRPWDALARMDQPTGALLRTPQTLTSCIRGPRGQPIPNVQVVLAPYSTPAHLLFTTDIDCTAMGFDGKELLATPRAVEALSRRRNIVRPEKYTVRGEWRTEARLLKYAARGFRAVDIGLQPGATASMDAKVDAAAKGAAQALKQDRAANVEPFIQAIRQSDVHGAQLLLLAEQSPELRQLMLHEVPKIRAGMQLEELVDLLRARRVQSGMDWWRQRRDNGQDDNSDDDDEGGDRSGPVINGDGNMEVNDGYGKATTQLLLVNPSRLGGARLSNGGLRGKEVRLGEAITELDLESDRFEVRGWYDGTPRQHLRHGSWELDPGVWRGLGDFRSAA